MTLSDEVCQQARALIASRLGLDFPEHRRADLAEGLARACRTPPMSTPEAYLAWLATLPGESPAWGRLAGYLTVGETYFFRDRAVFDALEQQILPALIAARRAEGVLRLRLWSAGCATGEEPYSLAILLDRLLPDRATWALTILATDVNPQALEVAQQGCYREWSFRETPQWIRDRWFHRVGGDRFEVQPKIRQMLAFAPLNLAADGYPSMDLILCRNVLMYFTPEAREATVARLRHALVPGGWLAVSPAEASVDLFRPLSPVSVPGALLYRKDPVSVTPQPPREPAQGWWDLPSHTSDVPTSSDRGSPHLPMTVPREEEEEEAPGAIYLAPVVNLLSAGPRNEPLAGGGGLTAGRLLESARMHG
jgi:chemotaxis protein methyltransferase CheR